MSNLVDKQSYESRWSQAFKNNDTNILKFKHGDSFPSFFYLEYNKLTLQLLEERLGSISNQTHILEVGCGRATASIYLGVSKGCKLKPIDYSENAIEIANYNLKSNNLPETAEVGDVYKYKGFKMYDAVISYGVMEHMPDIQKAYKAMLQHLKPGGVLISMNVPEKKFSVQSIFAPLNRVLYFIQRILNLSDSKPWLDKKNRGQTGSVFRTYSSPKIFRQNCESAGFIKTQIIEVNPFPTINPLPRLVEKTLVYLFSLLLHLENTFTRKKYKFQTSSILSRCHFIIAESPQ